MARPALRLLSVLAVSVLLATPASADPGTGWIRIKNEDGISVYTKEVKGSDLIAVKGKTWLSV